jgi:hypothetical protein
MTHLKQFVDLKYRMNGRAVLGGKTHSSAVLEVFLSIFTDAYKYQGKVCLALDIQPYPLQALAGTKFLEDILSKIPSELYLLYAKKYPSEGSRATLHSVS